MIRHLIRQLHSKVREAVKRVARSPEWPRVEKAHLASYPLCAGCGAAKHVQVHHKRPFHLHPELELDPDNLVTACMDTAECHVRICHGDDFKAYNPNVAVDLAEAFAHPERRAEIEARAKAARLYE